MRNRQFLMALTVFMMAGIVVASGCSNHQDTVETEKKPVIIEEESTHHNTGKTSTENKKNDPTISSSSGSDNSEAVLTPEKGDELGGGEAETNVEPDSDAPSEEEEPIDMEMPEIINYQPSEPRLMGLQIQQQSKQVTGLYGKPNREYVLDADMNPITVYEYEGFSVGFDDKETIVFVEVTSEHINPGLNGLHLGDLREDAITALGKPNTNTDFVMNYISSGVVLKLDIDPKTDEIRSLKLFAADV
ncbi:hypothetical protein [Marinicrinis lubricantis]|uniref:AMIN domain-containing protein n=1 Tax=Marinicrinis lubricantis TaxID=2086470 RepID=A0ABW1INS0_9BACL